MVLQTYDVVVVGDHLGGLAAAALAAKRGRRVMLFEDPAEPVEERPMHYLNSISGGPEREAGLGRFFHDLGLSPFGPLGDDRIHFRPLHPPLQVILPKHRVNIYQDCVARDWEMEREFGEVQRYLNVIQQKEEAFRERLFRFRTQGVEKQRPLLGRAAGDLSRLFRFRVLSKEAERQTLPQFLTSNSLPPGLADVLAGQAQGVTRLLPPSMPWAVGVRAIQVLQGGLFQNAAGQSGILNGLKEAFRRFGGECRSLVSIENIEYQRAEDVQLHLSAGGEIHAGHLIIDLPLNRAKDFFRNESMKLFAKKGLFQVAEEWHFGLMQLKMGEDWRPECMGRYIVIDPSSTPGSDQVTLLLADQPGGTSGENGGYSLEVLALSQSPQEKEKLRKKMWKRLEAIIPFLNKGLSTDVTFQTGKFPRYQPQSRGLRDLENFYRTGRRPSFFQVRHITFLRNEAYIGTCLTDGLLSGIRAVE